MAAKLETQASFAEEIDFNDLKFEKVRNRKVDIFATLGITYDLTIVTHTNTIYIGVPLIAKYIDSLWFVDSTQ